MLRNSGARSSILVAATLGTALVVSLGSPAVTLAQGGDKTDTRNPHKVDKRIGARRARALRLRRTVRRIAIQISGLRKRSVALARNIRSREARLDRLERQIKVAQARENQLVRGYAARQEQLARVLVILQRIQVHPPLLLAMNTKDPNSAVRAAIVIQRLTPHLRREASRLSREQRSLAGIRQRLRADRRLAIKRRRRLDQERKEIGGLLKRQLRLLRLTAGEQASLRNKIGDLRRRARNMQQLLARLEISRRRSAKTWNRTAAATRPNALRDFKKGVATLPVAGRIVRRFGEPDKQAERSKGIVIRARRNATVIAPYDGQIQFAGRFRNFGRILIIRHGGGYHSVLLGLNRIDVVAKQWVLAGEPVGVVGEFQASGPELYYEIRESGRPVDPLPWLAANQRNVR